MTHRILIAAAAAAAALTAGCGLQTRPPSDAAEGSVSSGLVIRGVNAPPPVGSSGHKNGRNCDFSREEVDQNKRMTGASVQCGSGKSLTQLLANLPATFNSYCAVDASRLKGTVITAAVPGNAEHCDLSAITQKDAQSQFGGAIWR